jgi:hypothetical protein
MRCTRCNFEHDSARIVELHFDAEHTPGMLDELVAAHSEAKTEVLKERHADKRTTENPAGSE